MKHSSEFFLGDTLRATLNLKLTNSNGLRQDNLFSQTCVVVHFVWLDRLMQIIICSLQ